jgi:hypothetical protein
MHYVMPRNARAYDRGRNEMCYVTPTPYSPEDAVIWLLLPAPDVPRTYAYFLDPACIDFIVGPVRAAPAAGIQYILPAGFTAEAIVVPGAPSGRWAVQVT